MAMQAGMMFSRALFLVPFLSRVTFQLWDFKTYQQQKRCVSWGAVSIKAFPSEKLLAKMHSTATGPWSWRILEAKNPEKHLNHTWIPTFFYVSWQGASKTLCGSWGQRCLEKFCKDKPTIQVIGTWVMFDCFFAGQLGRLWRFLHLTKLQATWSWCAKQREMSYSMRTMWCDVGAAVQ